MLVAQFTRSVSKVSSKVPLRLVLVVPFVIQIVGAVGIVGYLSFKNGQQAVNDVASQLRTEISSRIEQNLRTYLTIPHQVNYNNANAISIGQLNVKNVTQLERYFWYQLKVFDSLTFVGIGLENRDNLGAERSDDGSLTVRVATANSNYDFRSFSTNKLGDRVKQLNNKPDFDPRTRPWYKAAVAAGKDTWSPIYPHTKGITSYIGAARPFYDKNNQLQGVLLTNINLSQIGKFLQSLKIGKTGQSFIIERDGMLVATSTGETPITVIPGKDFGAERVKAVNSKNALTKATAEYLSANFPDKNYLQTPQQIEFKIKGDRYFLQILPIKDDKGLDWLIVVVVPESDFMAQINANNRTTILLCLAALGLATLIGVVTSQYIVKPILELKDAAKAISEGQFNRTVNSDRSDELGILAHAFNSMAKQLDASFTEMKVLNAELSENESRLNQLLEAIPVGIFVTDASGKPYYVNSRAMSLLGKGIIANTTSEEIRATYQIYLAGTGEIYPQEKDPVLSAIRGVSVNVDDIEIHQQDRHIPIEVWGTPIYDEKGKIVYAIAAFQDITQRRQAEKLVAEYNRTLEIQVQERTEELSQTLDHLKTTQQELIQSEKMAALGQLVAGVAHEINTPLGAIRSSAGTMAKFLNQTLQQLPRLYQSLTQEEVNDFLMLLNKSLEKDLTMSAKEERKLKRSLISQLEEEDIEDADRVADTLVDMGIYAADEFLSLLKKPERDYILEMAFKLSELQRGTETINTATDRASKVVFALKTYSRYDNTGSLIQFDILKGIETVLTLYHNQLKQGVEVFRNYQDIPQIMCYPDELNQVWTNIIHNAIQAMDNQGTLTIDAVHENEHVKIGITDSGKGIPPEILPKIFDPFFTTKPPGEGSGLGLDIVRKILEKHGGNITAESQPGRTTFNVILPVKIQKIAQ